MSAESHAVGTKPESSRSNAGVPARPRSWIVALALLAGILSGGRPLAAQWRVRMPLPPTTLWSRTEPALARPLTDGTAWRSPLTEADVSRMTWWQSDGPHPRRRGSYAKAAIIGGLAVGLLGASTGAGLCHFDNPCRHPAPFVVGGFLVGAVTGAAIGVRLATWHGRKEVEVDLHVYLPPSPYRLRVPPFGDR